MIIAVPTEDTANSSEWDRAAPTAVELNRLAVEQLPDSGVVVDFETSEYSMYAFSLTAGLQEHGTPFWVNDEISVRQYGDGRRADPDDGRPVVIAVSGFAALDAWDDDPVACAAQLDDGERARLTGARDALVGALRGSRVQLDGGRSPVRHERPGAALAGRRSGGPRPRGGRNRRAGRADALLDGAVLVPPPDLQDAASDLSTLGERINEKAGCILLSLMASLARNPGASRRCRLVRQAEHPSMPPHHLHDVSDDELVGRARAGDRPAYGELVRRHQVVALRLAAGICGSTEEARDIAQDAFVQGYRSLSRYRAEAPVRSWLLRIVANHAKNAVRSSARTAAPRGPLGHLDRADGGGDPVGEAVAGERDVAARLAALAVLPERDREVLAARFLAGLTEAETADLLGVPIGTVKSRGNRALARARSVLEVDEVRRG